MHIQEQNHKLLKHTTNNSFTSKSTVAFLHGDYANVTRHQVDLITIAISLSDFGLLTRLLIAL